MDLDQQVQYADFVMSRFKPGTKIIKELTAIDAEALHTCLGLIGELGELLSAQDRDNAIEELGDCEYYMSTLMHYAHHVGMTIDMINNVDTGSLPKSGGAAIIGIGDVCDWIKKTAIYRQEVTTSRLYELARSIATIRYSLAGAYEHWDTTGEETLQANINKLSERYSDGSYSDAQAQARADKTGETVH